MLRLQRLNLEPLAWRLLLSLSTSGEGLSSPSSTATDIAWRHKQICFLRTQEYEGGPGSRRFPPDYGFVIVMATPVEKIPARWRQGRGIKPQLPMTEVDLVVSLVKGWGSFSLHASLLSSVYVQAALGGGRPGW